MHVNGVGLSTGAVALLALKLHRAGFEGLAERVGVAVDANAPGIQLSRAEGRVVVTVLDPCPDALRPLRRALQAAEEAP